MIKVIGTTGCGHCAQAKAILAKNNIKFEYYLLNELGDDLQTYYINIAEKENRLNLPLIFTEDDSLTTLDSILENK